MSNKKIDGVVEAVHYGPDGKVKWVRAYLRRGPTFTDRILIDRMALMDHLKSGKNFFAGQRIPLEASTFKLRDPLRVIQNNGTDILVIGDTQADHDRLDNIPII